MNFDRYNNNIFSYDSDVTSPKIEQGIKRNTNVFGAPLLCRTDLLREPEGRLGNDG